MSDSIERIVTPAGVKGPWSVRARRVYPIVGEPIDGGVVTCLDGRIVSIGRAVYVPVRDLGDVTILPGWVNAHTHLEFSDLERPLPYSGTSFAQWIREVIAWRRGRQVDPRQSVERGLHESTQHGVAAVGEITTGTTWSAELRPSIDATVFHETICLAPARFAESLAAVDEFLDQRAAGATWRAGLSPHAPYTVHPRLLVELVARAKARELPVAMHLAESREELQLLRDGTGPLLELLQAAGIVWPKDDLGDFQRPRDYLQALSDAPRSLVIHGNYLSDDEIEFVAQRRDRMSVIYCPRTHAYFGHEPHPLDKLLQAGALVAIGTDGRGSNPDLSVWSELQCVASKYPSLSPQKVLKLGTINGAKALGIADRYGSIEPGKVASLIAVSGRLLE